MDYPVSIMKKMLEILCNPKVSGKDSRLLDLGQKLVLDLDDYWKKVDCPFKTNNVWKPADHRPENRVCVGMKYGNKFLIYTFEVFPAGTYVKMVSKESGKFGS